MLNENQKAPLDIKLTNLESKEVTLGDYLDKDYLVVYFYPKDDTEGCTKEACGFRDTKSEIESLNARVVGISKDSIKSHLQFIKKYNLNFELLSDESLKLHEAFGVWGEKILFGKTVIGTLRTTFILDKEGNIIKVLDQIEASKHAEEVIKFLKELV